MAFGSKQLKNPTPSNINNWAGAISGVSGVIIAWLQTASFIPENVSDIISAILGLVAGLVQVMRPFFGVALSGEDVPVSQVTAVDSSAGK